MIKLGQTFSHNFQFTQKEVNLFAEVTGDNNPVHIDSEYASTTMFKKPIIHGMLGASIFSKVFGTLFPGEGTIYLNQELKFSKPMYVEKEYTAFFEVVEVNEAKHRAKIDTFIKDEEGDIVTSGSALIMNVSKI
jgi:acyl dehydratase